MVLGVWRLLCLCAPSRDQRIVWHGLGRNSGDCMDCSATGIYTSFIYSSFMAKFKAVLPYLKGRKDASIKAHAGLHEPPLHDDQMQGCVAIPERKERRTYKDTRPEAVFRRVSIDSGSCSVM